MSGTKRLISAIKSRNTVILSEMLENMDLDKINGKQNGQTALHFACDRKFNAAVDLLVAKNGIDVNVKDCGGKTSLYVAVLSNNGHAVTKILTHPQVDVNAQNNCGFTPLHIACMHNNHQAIWELLGSPGVDVNIREYTGMTPVMNLAQGRDEETLKLMLEDTRVNFDLKDQSGRGLEVLVGRSRGDSKTKQKFLEMINKERRKRENDKLEQEQTGEDGHVGIEILSSLSATYTRHKDGMDVDDVNINGPLAIKDENTIKIETKTINTEKQEIVHKLKKALKFLEDVNVQNEESLQLSNLHAPLDKLLASIKKFPVQDGKCFNDLPTELKANILSESYLCDPCAYVAASVCHEWKEIIEKRLMERGSIQIGHDDEDVGYGEDEDYFHCFLSSDEDMLKAAIIHKMKIELRLRPVTNVDSKLLAEALTTISDFGIHNAFMCYGCNDCRNPVELTENQLEHLFEAIEDKTEIDRVHLRGLSTAHLDQEKVIGCLFKVKELTLSEGPCHYPNILWCWYDERCPPGGPVVDMEQFVEKLLQTSSEMKLIDLKLGYFENIPQNLSVNLANALCKVKSVSLNYDFPLQDATRDQLIKNILGGGIVMNSLSISKNIQWKSAISVEDLEMVINNLKHLQVIGDFTAEQLKMARSFSGVKVIEEIDKIYNYEMIKDEK